MLAHLASSSKRTGQPSLKSNGAWRERRSRLMDATTHRKPRDFRSLDKVGRPLSTRVGTPCSASHTRPWPCESGGSRAEKSALRRTFPSSIARQSFAISHLSHSARADPRDFGGRSDAGLGGNLATSGPEQTCRQGPGSESEDPMLGQLTPRPASSGQGNRRSRSPVWRQSDPDTSSNLATGVASTDYT
jgi:hypothetical protein